MSNGLAIILEQLRDDNPEAILLAGLDAAILGITTGDNQPPRAVYSARKIIGILMERDGMTRDDATEFFDFNISGLYAGPYSPVLVDDEFLSEPDS